MGKVRAWSSLGAELLWMDQDHQIQCASKPGGLNR